jgi:hypothetical protein
MTTETVPSADRRELTEDFEGIKCEDDKIQMEVRGVLITLSWNDHHTFHASVVVPSDHGAPDTVIGYEMHGLTETREIAYHAFALGNRRINRDLAGCECAENENHEGLCGGIDCGCH